MRSEKRKGEGGGGGKCEEERKENCEWIGSICVIYTLNF